MDSSSAPELGEPPPSAARSTLFVVLLGLYYGIYYLVFAARVGEYVRAILMQFDFIHRLF